MRLFIDGHYFISVLKEEKGFNCQIMELLNGFGMEPVTITEDQKDVVSSIVYGIFREESRICKDLAELFSNNLAC